MLVVLGQAFDSVLHAAQQGSAWAFERLWEDLGPLVVGYLRVQGASDPDDLASETFIGLFRGIEGFSGDERSLRSWVLVIAHRRLLDERRRQSRRPVVDQEASGVLDEVPGGDVEADAMERVGTAEVERLLAGLSDEQRSVLALRIMGDLTIEQVAEVLGKRPGAVKALQRRALARLRKETSPEGVPL